MDDLTLQLFFDSWELFKDPAIAAMLLGGLLGMLGVYVVIKRIVFFSAALSQVAGLGVALSFWLKIGVGASWLTSPYLGAAATCLVAVGYIMTQRGQASASRDSALGLIFLLGSAGTLSVGTRIVQEVQDIESLLFGSAVAVLPEDFNIMLITVVLLGALHVWWHRGFVVVSVDADDADVRGLNAILLEWVLLLSLAAGISVATRVLGALPTFAFSVLPAMAALKLAPNVPRAMAIATILGATAGFGGYVAAFLYQLPVGASQTIVAAILVVICSGIGWLITKSKKISPSAQPAA
jgi:zinc transport system permease protein